MSATNTPEENKQFGCHFTEEVTTEGHIDRIDERCTEEVIEHNPLRDRRGRDELEKWCVNRVQRVML